MMWSPTHIQITVQRSRNLILKGKSGTNDAYVVIELDNQKFQTSVKQQSVDPTWNEQCDLKLEDKNAAVINLSVFHRNFFGLSDELLGQAFISLIDYDTFERPRSRWFTLVKSNWEEINLEQEQQQLKQLRLGELEVEFKFLVKTIDCEERLRKLSGTKGIHQSFLDLRDKDNNEKNLSSFSPFSTQENNNKLSFQKPKPQRRFSIAFGNKALPLALPKETPRRFSLFKEAFNLENILKNNEKNTKKSNELNSVRQDSIEKNLDEKKKKKKSEKNNEKMSDDKLKNKENVKNSLKTTILTKTVSSGNIFSIDFKDQDKKLDKKRLTHSDRSLTMPSFDLTSQKIHVANSYKTDIKVTASTTTLSQKRIEEECLLEERQSNMKVGHKLEAPESPDSFYSSLESISRSTSSTKMKKESFRNKLRSVHDGKYSNLTNEELIQLVETQHYTIFRLNEKINDLEKYIDNLLVRVIENSPKLLHNLDMYKKQI